MHDLGRCCCIRHLRTLPYPCNYRALWCLGLSEHGHNPFLGFPPPVPLFLLVCPQILNLQHQSGRSQVFKPGPRVHAMLHRLSGREHLHLLGLRSLPVLPLAIVAARVDQGVCKPLFSHTIACAQS